MKYLFKIQKKDLSKNTCQNKSKKRLIENKNRNNLFLKYDKNKYYLC